MLSWVVWGLGSHRLDVESGNLLLVLFLGFFFPILSDLSKFPSSFCDRNGSSYSGVKFCPFRICMSRFERVRHFYNGEISRCTKVLFRKHAVCYWYFGCSYMCPLCPMVSFDCSE